MGSRLRRPTDQSRRLHRGWGLGLSLMCGALLLTACSKTDRTESSNLLARVGDATITVNDFNAEVARLRQAKRPVPDNETLLQELVHHAALVQRARQTGLTENPEIKRELDNLLIGKLVDQELAPRLQAVQVRAEEVKAEYETNRAQYTRSAKVRLAIVQVKTTPVMSDAKRAEVRARIEEARRRALAAPAPGGRGPAAGGFGAVALECSEDPASRYRGGDIGWLDAGRLDYPWPKTVIETGYALEPGKVSDVLEAEGGLYLVMKTDARGAATVSFAQVESSLRQRVLAEKRREIETAFRQEAARLANARINRDALAALPAPLRSETNVAQNREAGPPALPGVHHDP